MTPQLGKMYRKTEDFASLISQLGKMYRKSKDFARLTGQMGKILFTKIFHNDYTKIEGA